MKTRIIIDVETDFKPFIMKQDDGEKEDYVKEVEDTFHNKIFEIIENFIIDEDNETQNQIIESINQEYFINNEKNEEIKEYSNLGKVHIVITQEEIKWRNHY